MYKIKSILLLLLFLNVVSLHAQDNLHQASVGYEWPRDPLVRQKLEAWQDKKFGMIIHWGIYSVPGIMESWPICSEEWTQRDTTLNYEDYKKWYWGQSEQFNPVNFNPEQWANAADEAGMKYVVFTTKHHDGFAMFDTKQSDFSIAKGPFANDPKKDVVKYVFDAFRKHNFMIGAYFSKPDWHSKDYWWPRYATANRNNNYDIRKNPQKWDAFKKFTYNQISELMHNYGTVDLLWLDGGWVRPKASVTKEILNWGMPIPDWGQDIDIPNIAGMARTAQPGLIIVDRTVHGQFENYQTPEQSIPSVQLSYPWETCMTLTKNWGYIKNDTYRTAKDVVQKLVEIVAKGGSLLLGVGPKPDGLLEDTVIARLNEIGRWTSVNGRSIYGTRITKHYNEGQTWFTESKDGNTIYAIYLIKDTVPEIITWKGNSPKKGTVMTLINNTIKVKWFVKDGVTQVHVPKTKENIAISFAYKVDRREND